LAEALMVNTVLQSMSLQSNNVSLNVNGNRIGEDGAQSLAKALKVNNTLVSINLCRCHISTVGAKFLAEALMINTKLEGKNLSANMIGDEGVQSLAESFTVNRSLRNIQLSKNRITDIGATKLADAIEFNCDCDVTINLKGNQISASLLDMIESVCKAKKSEARDRKLQFTLQIVGSKKSKDDQIASLKEHIALLEKDNARLNDNLRNATPIVETIDLTTNEAERATKRSRTERNVKSTLAIMYEQNQKVVHMKKEKMDTEMALESIRGEKNVVEADLKEVKEDLEDVNELVGQMSLTTDIWQGRFDELVALVESGNADGASINAIRNRPLGSGK